ncbi:hypothetical protein KNP414_02011 [Paenibacillus mucilaginosus KNP414]|uniref:Uncharacterized protein n=1 Tax=Paenibacillus mucilaginosus (strain KNP414) TaxID=1036673 RepID=F8FRL5_PAEMK|nr:hypothetical protein KNP414_02011 [Paenibacillus mucilaginosus KNP414]
MLSAYSSNVHPHGNVVNHYFYIFTVHMNNSSLHMYLFLLYK